MSDMIIGGLSTMSNGRLLETSGMVYINIKTENGEKVYLEDTKCMFQTPKQATINEDVLLFQGNINKQGEINWDLNVTTVVCTDTVLMNKNYIDQSYFFQINYLRLD